MKLLFIILLIAIGVFLIRKAAVIGVAIVMGAIILMLSVTILRDQLHIPVNDYVDTTQIDELRDKVVPVTIGPEKTEEELAEEERIKKIEEETGEKFEEVNYDLLTEDEINKIMENLNKIENGENIKEKEVKELNNKIVENETKEEEKTKEEEQQKLEGISNKYVISYKDLTEEKRLEIYETLKDKVEDKNFKNKLLGMSNYVLDLEYDLGNGKMYNSKNGEEIIILITN